MTITVYYTFGSNGNSGNNSNTGKQRTNKKSLFHKTINHKILIFQIALWSFSASFLPCRAMPAVISAAASTEHRRYKRKKKIRFQAKASAYTKQLKKKTSIQLTGKKPSFRAPDGVSLRLSFPLSRSRSLPPYPCLSLSRIVSIFSLLLPPHKIVYILHFQS